MATFYFTGEAQWAHVYEAKPTYDKKGKEWTINLKLDEASAKLFADSGCQLKTNKDGFKTFRRPTQKVIKDDLVDYAPPTVFDKNNAETTDLIGNGSTVTIKVEIYNTAKGKGHRLEAVRIEDLVVYEGNQVVSVDGVVPF
jgi:hypothetical protein